MRKNTGRFVVRGVGGRAPKCENCQNGPSEKFVDGSSALTRIYLCGECFEDLGRAVAFEHEIQRLDSLNSVKADPALEVPIV